MNGVTLRKRHPESWRFHEASARSALELPPPGEPDPLPAKEYPAAPFRPLPPAMPLDLSLGDAIARRSSYRGSADGSLAIDALATVLFAAYGARRRESEDADVLDRPVPSAGGLYPLEVYVQARAIDGVAPGLHHYQPVVHGLEHLGTAVLPEHAIARLYIGQQHVATAQAVLVITAVFERSLRKYDDRGYRYVLLEAGHVAQNVALVAAALGLGALSVGAFFDRELAFALGVDPEIEAPVYAIAISRPDPADGVPR